MVDFDVKVTAGGADDAIDGAQVVLVSLDTGEVDGILELDDISFEEAARDVRVTRREVVLAVEVALPASTAYIFK